MEMYWLRRGRLRLSTGPGDGGGKKAADSASAPPTHVDLAPGDSFGQDALLANERQKFDVSALLYSDMLYLSREVCMHVGGCCVCGVSSAECTACVARSGSVVSTACVASRAIVAARARLG